MKRAILCGIILFFVSVLQAQDFLYVQSPGDTLTVIPSENVVGYTKSADGAFFMLSTGKTLVIPDAESITRECPFELPGFESYRFRKNFNDQLFQSVTASDEELLQDTIHLSVAQIGKYLTASFQLTDDDAVAWVGSVRQESMVTRQRMATPITYTIGRENWRQLQILQDDLGDISYKYVPFGRQVTVCVDFLTDHPTGDNKDYNVPRIDITTATGTVPLSKTSYVSGTITIDGCGVFPDMAETDILIKGRGNSSWSSSNRSKNPYHFKFAEKQKPLGMTNGKHWILLSNKIKGSMLCNALEQKASALAGCAYPCHIVPVELYINGHYRGSYNLTEKVGFYNNSVSLDDESCAAMLELDTYTDEDIWYYNPYYVSTKIHDPDFEEDDSLLSITQDDILYDWYSATRTLRYGDSEDYTGCFDVDYLVSYLFANELCYNTELQHAKSVFLYSENVLDEGLWLTGIDETPWIFGPMWDCDWSFGYSMGSTSYFVNCAESSYYNSFLKSKLNGFWYDLRYKSQQVDKAYFSLWHNFMNDGRFQELIDYIQDYYEYAAPSLKHNSSNETNEKDGSSYIALSKRAADWFRKRANYVYKGLNAYDIDEDEEPAEAMPYIIDTDDGIEGIQNEMADGEWYDLSGRKWQIAEGRRITLQRGIYVKPDGRKVLVK